MALRGKIAIVTGASRGIGRAVAIKLAKDGAAVAVNYFSSKDAADEVVSLIKQAGGKAVAIRGNANKKEDIVQLFDKTEAEFGGKPDIVVANAFSYKSDALFSPVSAMTDDYFESVFTDNARGVFYTLREAANRINDGGHIIAVSSVVTIVGRMFPGTAAYTAQKAATEAMARILSQELGPRKVSVNIVSPALTETDMAPAAFKASAATLSASGRIGQPEDMANAVYTLVSPLNTWINGQNIIVNGGFP